MRAIPTGGAHAGTRYGKWTATGLVAMAVRYATITTSVIGIRPRNGAPAPLVQITSASGSVAAHPTATVTVANGFVLVGGGAEDHWSAWGNMLFASYPSGNSWVGMGKDHLLSDPGYIKTYTIGLR